MARSLAERLTEKGWKPDEIKKAINIMESSEHTEEKIFVQRKINPVVYWMALVIMILGNLIIAVVMIPFILVLTQLTVYSVLLILAFGFGLLFNLVINDIENIDPQHHIIAGLFIPAFAIITVFVMISVAQVLGNTIKFPVRENPIIVGAVYVFGFMLPYLWQKLREFWQSRRLLAYARKV